METLFFILTAMATLLGAVLLLAPIAIFIRNVENALCEDHGSAPTLIRHLLGSRRYFGLIFNSLRRDYTPAAVADTVAEYCRLMTTYPPAR